MHLPEMCIYDAEIRASQLFLYFNQLILIKAFHDEACCTAAGIKDTVSVFTESRRKKKTFHAAAGGIVSTV